ncbi:MAG: hypothetical protein GY773_15915 [Actinomycetia bacterium]|nr:hypothetical protein [Actinomycetes bacterium]MCP5034476.1 hypothetical protein [Actinomycetes bacterium]
MERIEPRLDLSGMPKKKVDEVLTVWLRRLIEDAWPSFAAMAADPDAATDRWHQEAGDPFSASVAAWVAQQELAQPGHQPSSDLSALVPNQN